MRRCAAIAVAARKTDIIMHTYISIYYNGKTECGFLPVVDVRERMQRRL